MRELKLMALACAVAFCISGLMFRYMHTEATGAPDWSVDCPHCGGKAVAQNPSGKFIGEWKCTRCLKWFRQ